MTERSKVKATKERGTALVAAIILLLLLSVLAVTASNQAAMRALGQVYSGQSTHAFFAAESAMEKSLRELSDNTDHDSNGTIGSIDATTFGSSSAYTTYSAPTLTAYGTDGDAKRILSVSVSL